MHELTVTQQILNIVLEEANSAALKRVEKVKIVVGQLKGFVPDSIKFYFDFFSEDTIVSKAELEIVQKEALACCQKCDNMFVIEDVAFFCPDCGNLAINIIQGNEFFIDAIWGD